MIIIISIIAPEALFICILLTFTMYTFSHCFVKFVICVQIIFRLGALFLVIKWSHAQRVASLVDGFFEQIFLLQTHLIVFFLVD